MYLKRPEIVQFDASNKHHRAAARAFLRRKAWVDCPLRFAHDTGYGSVSEQIQTKMLEWYVAQEEAKETKKEKHPVAKSGMFLFPDAAEVVDLKLQKMTTDMLLGMPDSK